MATKVCKTLMVMISWHALLNPGFCMFVCLLPICLFVWLSVLLLSDLSVSLSFGFCVYLSIVCVADRRVSKKKLALDEAAAGYRG